MIQCSGAKAIVCVIVFIGFFVLLYLTFPFSIVLHYVYCIFYIVYIYSNFISFLRSSTVSVPDKLNFVVSSWEAFGECALCSVQLKYHKLNFY